MSLELTHLRMEACHNTEFAGEHACQIVSDPEQEFCQYLLHICGKKLPTKREFGDLKTCIPDDLVLTSSKLGDLCHVYYINFSYTTNLPMLQWI